MGLRVLGFSIVVFGSMYYLHTRMQKLLNERKAIREGVPIVMTEKDKINAVGGAWVLKDL